MPPKARWLTSSCHSVTLNTQFSQFVIEVFPKTYSLPRLRINRTLKCDFTKRSVFSNILNCYKFYLASLS